jgi:Protein phosphatase 2C
MIVVSDYVTDPENASNADGLVLGKNMIAIIDGAANLGPSKIPDFANDAVWLAREIEDRISKKTLSKDHSTVLALEEIRQEILSEYNSYEGNVDERPFACLGIVREIGSCIEILNMGDLSFIIEMKDGSLQKFGESAVRVLDGQALQSLQNQIIARLSPHEARMQAVWPQILSNRSKRNAMQGYEVFDIEHSCASSFERKILLREEVKSLLLMTDGFYRCVDTFKIYTDQTLFQILSQKKLSQIKQEVRSLEEKDSECELYPRFKKHDDATAISLKIE